MSESFVWLGPVGDRGGYGNVARNYLRGLIAHDTHVVAQSTAAVHPEIGARELQMLESLPQEVRGDETLVVHDNPGGLAILIPRLREQWAGRIAACTIAETDRLPVGWAAGCDLADEVWVPTTFNELTFAASGVDPAALRLVPYGVDPATWEVEGARADALAPDDHTVFVYTFAFDWRKGFDVLLTAYLEAFTRADPVTLVLKVYDPRGGGRSIRGLLASSVADHVDLFRDDLPRVVVLDQPVARDELEAIYRRADLYISTDRANGWGMPCFESMVLGRATATIDWSGSTEFMTEETSLLIPPRELVPIDGRLTSERPAYAGQRWPAVRIEDVQSILRAAAGGEVDLAALGARGREAILDRFTVERAGEYILGRDSGAYERVPGLTERLRPLIGLLPEPALADARDDVLVCDWSRGRAAASAAVSAFLEAFGPDDLVTLCLWAPPGTDEAEIATIVLEELASRGIDPETAPDLMVCASELGDVLAEPRVRGFVDEAPEGRPCRAVVPAHAASMRAAMPIRPAARDAA